VGDLSPEEIARVFRPQEKYGGLLGAQTATHKIALFYHAAYLEAFGRQIPYAPIPDEIVRHIAGVLGCDVPSPFVYPDLQITFLKHAEKVRRALGWQRFVPKVRASFERWLAEEARRSLEPDYLRGRLEGQLFASKIVLPAESRTQRMISRARVVAQEWITRQVISSGLTDAQLSEIDRLRRLRPGSHRTMLQWLKDPIGQASPSTLDDILDRLELLNGLRLPERAFEKIHPDMRRRLAKVVQTYSTDSLFVDFRQDRRRAYVAVYLFERRRELVDLAVEAFDGIMLGIHRRSEAEFSREREKRGPAINEKLWMFCVMAEIHLDREVPDPEVRARTFREIPREELTRALAEAKELRRPKDYNYLDYIGRRYTYVRTFFPRFLEVVLLEGLPRAAEILEAVATLRGWNREKVRHVPTGTPLGFVSEAWRPYAQPEPGRIDRHSYELALLDALHGTLKSGDVWAVGGRRYGNVEDLLIPRERWKEIRTDCYRELGLPEDPKVWLGKTLGSLREQIVRTTANLEKNPQTILEECRVKLRPIEAVAEPDRLRLLKKRIEASWPQVRIQDLLVEVDSWVGFSQLFRTLQKGKVAGAEFGRGLFAALIAKGCNLGMTKMAALTPGVREGTLRRVDELYLYEDTLREAYRILQESHQSLPMADLLGDPEVSMSDGMRVVTRVGTLRAALHPHLLGPGKRALTFYWHVSHQGPGFSAQVIGHDRDAAFVLDEIFHIQSELPIHLHFCDTHGTTRNTHGLAYPLGIEYAPRIKRVHEVDLFSPPGMQVTGPFAFHFAGAVDTELIETYWDDYVRILSSIKRGHTSAVLLSLRLSSYARQNPLYRILSEVGKIFETRFILKYYDEPAYRRRINAGLNRIEHFNDLARVLYFARRGENWEREFEQQLGRASALLFLANACVLWNTVRLSEMYRALKVEGWEIDSEDFRHVSPYAYEHILPFGEYRFRRQPGEGREAFENAKRI
jgi:TnpA family transposase